jgi:hypothetical protein
LTSKLPSTICGEFHWVNHCGLGASDFDPWSICSRVPQHGLEFHTNSRRSLPFQGFRVRGSPLDPPVSNSVRVRGSPLDSPVSNSGAVSQFMESSAAAPKIPT